MDRRRRRFHEPARVGSVAEAAFHRSSTKDPRHVPTLQFNSQGVALDCGISDLHFCCVHLDRVFMEPNRLQCDC